MNLPSFSVFETTSTGCIPIWNFRFRPSALRHQLSLPAKMPKHSAGVLLYRASATLSRYSLLLVKPGGPFWRGKVAHAFGVPKGEFEPGQENVLACARREFQEETGAEAPAPEDLTLLGEFKVSNNNKIVHVFVGEGDFDCARLVSNSFEMGGKEFPEVDEAKWVDVGEAEEWLHKGQAPIAGAMRKFLEEK